MNDNISKQALMKWLEENYGSYALTGGIHGSLYSLLKTSRFDSPTEEKCGSCLKTNIVNLTLTLDLQEREEHIKLYEKKTNQLKEWLSKQMTEQPWSYATWLGFHEVKLYLKDNECKGICAECKTELNNLNNHRCANLCDGCDLEIEIMHEQQQVQEENA